MGGHVTHICTQASRPPVRLYDNKEIDRFENLMGSLLSTYLKERNKLQLNEALWKYWIGNNLPIGCNIPIISTGIEIISTNWHKSKRSKSKGEYMSQQQYNKLFGSELNSFEQKCKTIQFGERILSKVQNAYSMTGNERLDSFIDDELGITLGKLDRDSFQCRNKMIHNALDLKKTDLEKLILFTKANRTTFNIFSLSVLILMVCMLILQFQDGQNEHWKNHQGIPI